MDQEFSLLVGIDWATEEHQVCGVDAKGNKRFELKVRHTGDDITKFADRLVKEADGQLERIAVAIETPRGSIVETLMDRGIAAFSINPKQLDRFRDRHSVGGAKSDRLDAFVLADSLRTDLKLYRRIEAINPVAVELREMRRAHDSLTRDAVALGSRVREQLLRYYPQILDVGSPYDDRWIWDLLERAPTPAEGARLSVAKVNTILKEHRVRRVTAQEVVAKLREKPLFVAPGVSKAASAHVKLLLPLARLNRDQMKACHGRLESLLEQLCQPVESESAPVAGGAEPSTPREEHRDAQILLSVPGLGTLNGAAMLGEASTALRERDYQSLRTMAGVAPVSSQTGKQCHAAKGRHKIEISQRRACNEALRHAVVQWARLSIQHDERAREHFAELRARGHSFGRALRGLADRLLAMLIAMLKSGTLYDDARRSARKKSPAGELAASAA